MLKAGIPITLENKPDILSVLNNMHRYANQLAPSSKEKVALIVFSELIASCMPIDNGPAAYYKGFCNVFDPTFRQIIPDKSFDQKIWQETFANKEFLEKVKQILLIALPKMLGENFAKAIDTYYKKDHP